MTETLENRVQAFLREEFRPDRQYSLRLEVEFNHHPIRGPIHAALYSFDVEGDHYYVFGGDTVPMIYPQMDLTIDELWPVQLGTEYFLEQDVTEDTDRKSPIFLTYLKMVSTVFQEQLYISKPDAIKIQKVYKLHDQKHIVGQAQFQDKTYSWIVGDITHFVYKKDLPPQITWALHMGRILLT
ncbi:MAG TPA: hypothetical protein VLR94_00705 [Acidobacteriota bacterium]|nr:hypothetical protein [Acidobacteriota bacterium]